MELVDTTKPNHYRLRRAIFSVLSATALVACGQNEHVAAGTLTSSMAGNSHETDTSHCAEQIGAPGVHYGLANTDNSEQELDDYIDDKNGARTNYITNRLDDFVKKDDVLGVSGAYGFSHLPEDEAYANS